MYFIENKYNVKIYKYLLNLKSVNSLNLFLESRWKESRLNVIPICLVRDEQRRKTISVIFSKQY